jgi:hypothetical protein
VLLVINALLPLTPDQFEFAPDRPRGALEFLGDLLPAESFPGPLGDLAQGRVAEEFQGMLDLLRDDRGHLGRGLPARSDRAALIKVLAPGHLAAPSFLGGLPPHGRDDLAGRQDDEQTSKVVPVDQIRELLGDPWACGIPRSQEDGFEDAHGDILLVDGPSGQASEVMPC